MRILKFILLSFIFQGCAVIHFTNGNEELKPHHEKLYSKITWHHTAILSFAEVSAPVNLSKRCKDNWSYVTTKKDILQLLIGSFNYISTWYQPWSVQVNCKK